MAKRGLIALVGLGCLAGVILLGVWSSKDTSYLVWFGLAAAILAPIGLSVISYAITGGHRQLFEKLSKVPEIESLISKAKSQEEKITLLEQERKNLEQIIRVESCIQTLNHRKKSLEKEATHMLKEMDAIDEELKTLNVSVETSPIKEEINKVRERIQARQEGLFVIRLFGADFTLTRDILYAFPMGSLIWLLMRLASLLEEKARAKRTGRGSGHSGVNADRK